MPWTIAKPARTPPLQAPRQSNAEPLESVCCRAHIRLRQRPHRSGAPETSRRSAQKRADMPSKLPYPTRQQPLPYGGHRQGTKEYPGRKSQQKRPGAEGDARGPHATRIQYSKPRVGAQAHPAGDIINLMRFSVSRKSGQVDNTRQDTPGIRVWMVPPYRGVDPYDGGKTRWGASSVLWRILGGRCCRRPGIRADAPGRNVP